MDLLSPVAILGMMVNTPEGHLILKCLQISDFYFDLVVTKEALLLHLLKPSPKPKTEREISTQSSHTMPTTNVKTETNPSKFKFSTRDSFTLFRESLSVVSAH